ncbi:pentatricopeptide repeat-containing protein At1g53600, mitochondrial [Elaeis guineensis]|uniref:Pentatricopeptide repeat-containing protein At1g53600, mitochondrial n=1 Tax=Elaeis guineensis var. tenera TaxID=51953 RepID=A0A6I9QPJ2_ELAGV|nr:pentatricopeptide repeat-containing protein At1g53600, mitochondrial [Elaeis guineensis]
MSSIMLRKLIPYSLQKNLCAASPHLLLRYSSALPSPSPKRREATIFNAKTGSHAVFYNSQITKNGRNGNLQEAQSIFDHMPFRDVVSWTALLTAYAENGDVSKARQVFDQMPKRNTASWNAMISAYARALKVSEAYELFSKMPTRNVVSYGAMIMGFAKNGMLEEAEEVYQEMPQMGRDPVASNALICGYLKAGKLDKAVQVFNRMGMRDVVSWSSMVDGYCKNGRISDARDVFDAMPERNVVSWTAMVRGYLKAGFWEEGFRLFVQMRRDAVRISSTTFSVMLDACADKDRIREGVQIHGLALTMGLECDVFLGNSVISMYSRAGWMTAARRSFDCMKEKDVVSWNSLINGYVQLDAIEEAYALFELMPERDVVSWTSLVVGFSNRGWTKESVRIFEQMPKKDGIAWTAIISGFVSNREHESALRWFGRMVEEGFRPNPVMLSSVLSALAGLAILDLGMQVHACIIKMDFEVDVAIQSSLVSMYAKCGDVRDAYRIFSSVHERNLVTVNSMITAFAQHGLAEEALKLFAEMLKNGYKPTQVTFLGLLSACAHAGLVEEGYKYFKSMRSYGVEPGPDHYTCMVDILGRAGLLKDAMELINSMPCKPHAAAWGALLNASRIHFNLEFAELAAQQLFDLEPNNATAYAVLSSMYSLAGLKEDEEKVRMLKQSNGVRKIPGYSRIIPDQNANQWSRVLIPRMQLR